MSAVRSHFYRAWAAEFNSPPEPAELGENFAGLRHRCASPTTVEMSCLGVVRSLEGLLSRAAPDSARFCPLMRSLVCANHMTHSAKI